MKEIKIFIGSSVDKNEFELEREKLGSFINGLNRKYIKQGIFIDLYDCETVSNQMRAEGSQKQHDDYIENEADATFFMFFKKAGEFTLHELQIARDALVNQNRPDIFTYFKVVGDDIEETDQIKKAVDIIANSYGHYFSKFTDVDTIKLGMLQYIADKLNDGSSVTIYDGEFYISNTKVEGIELDNIFAYQNNGEYKKLKEKLAELDDKINAAIKNKQFKDVETFTQQKENAEKVFAKLESDILNMLINMQKELQKGNINHIRMQAYQLLEMGRIKEAQKLIPIEILKAKSENLLLKNKIQQQDNKDLVENAKVRIKALRLDVSNSDRFNMMADTYESVIENAFLCYDDVFIYDYASFLDYVIDSKKAYKFAKRLENLYLINDIDIKEKSNLADLYNLLGIICDNISLFDEEEYYYKKAIKLKEKLATIKPELHNFDLTIFYRNIANYYRTQNDNEKALSFYIKAMNIQETFLNKNKKCLYNNTDNIFEDNDYYQLFPLGKREELGNVYPEIKVVDLFISYNEIGNIYEHLENIKRAEYYYKKAIRISEVLSKLNQPKYGFDLANNYFNIGLFYNHQNDLILTEYYYNKAINIINQLDKCNSLLMHKSRLAEIYNCFGTFYAKQSNIEKAEHYYLRAISINEQLVIENPERYNANLADNYNNISSLYDDFGNIEQTKYYYRKSIKIYVQLAKYNPERYNGALAINFYRYGNISNESKYFNKALKLAKMQPDNPYCRQIISALEN